MNKWIALSNQEPPVFTWVLTISNKAKYPRIMRLTKFTKEINRVNLVEWDSAPVGGFHAKVAYDKVTHWMLLPDLPEDKLKQDA